MKMLSSVVVVVVVVSGTLCLRLVDICILQAL